MLRQYNLFILCLATAIMLAGLPWIILHKAPAEAEMNDFYRIFYLHLPLAWWALFGFFTVFSASIMYLWKRKEIYDQFAKCATETALLFCIMALITGSIWAKLAWGTWWRWEPKLTTTLIVCLLYAACLLVRTLPLPGTRKKIITAIIAIAAFINVPFIFLSTRIGLGAHPPAIVTQQSGIAHEMFAPLAYSIVCIGFLWLCFTYICLNQECLKIRLKQINSKSGNLNE